MKLGDIKENDIIQIVRINVPKRTLERFESINVKKGKKFFVKEFVKEKYVKLQYEENNSFPFLIIGKSFFDKIEIIKYEG